MSDRVNSFYAKACPNGILDLLRQILLFWVLYQGYRLVRGLADDPAGAAVAFQHARNLISIEQTLNVFVEPQIQHWAEGVPGLLDACSWLYINAQTTITLGGLVYLYLRHNESFYFVRNMFMVAFALALVGYTLYPTAPPRFFPEWGFFDAVSGFVGVDHTDGVNRLFNPYAAVPSMHVCFSMMVGIPLSRLATHRPVRWFWRTYPLLVTFVIVATANHFLSDAFLGACTFGIAYLAATTMARARPEAWSLGRAEQLAASR